MIWSLMWSTATKGAVPLLLAKSLCWDSKDATCKFKHLPWVFFSQSDLVHHLKYFLSLSLSSSCPPTLWSLTKLQKIYDIYVCTPAGPYLPQPRYNIHPARITRTAVKMSPAIPVNKSRTHLSEEKKIKQFTKNWGDSYQTILSPQQKKDIGLETTSSILTHISCNISNDKVIIANGTKGLIKNHFKTSGKHSEAQLNMDNPVDLNFEVNPLD